MNDVCFSSFPLATAETIGRQVLGTAEFAMDVLGYIPVCSPVVGAFRSQMGSVEWLIGLVCYVVAKVALDFNQGNVAGINMREMESFGNEMMRHGFGNFVRGWVESVKWLNLACLLFDIKKLYFASDSDLVNNPKMLYGRVDIRTHLIGIGRP